MESLIDDDVDRKLIASIEKNDLDAVCKILDSLTEEEQEKFNSKNVDGKPLLIHACMARATRIADYLIKDCGVDIDSPNDVLGENLTPLFVAIKTRNMFLLQTLITFHVDLSWKDHEKRNALVFACWERNFEAAKILKEKGVDINSDKNVYYCAEDVSYLKAALKLGTDVHFCDSGGNTILMKAVLNGNLSIVSMLLNKHNIPYHRNKLGANALDIANYKENIEMLDLCRRQFYTQHDYALSLEYCGAYFAIFNKDLDKCLDFWESAITQRKTYANQIPPKSDFASKDFPLDLKEFEHETDLHMHQDKDLLVDALLVLSRILTMKSPVTKKAFCCVALCGCFEMDIQTRFTAIIHVLQLNVSDPHPKECDIFYTWCVFGKLANSCFLKFESTDVEEIYVVCTNVVNIIREYVWPFIKSRPKYITSHLKRYKFLQMMVLRNLQYLCKHITDPEYKRIAVLLAKSLAKDYLLVQNSLLHLCVSFGFSVSVAKLLIDCGANINAVDEEGNVPLHLLIDKPSDDPDRDEMARLFIEEGCNLDAENGSNVVLRDHFGSLIKEVENLKISS